MNYDHIPSEEIVQDIRDTEVERNQLQRELDECTSRINKSIQERNDFIQKLARILDQRRNSKAD